MKHRLDTLWKWLCWHLLGAEVYQYGVWEKLHSLANGVGSLRGYRRHIWRAFRTFTWQQKASPKTQWIGRNRVPRWDIVLFEYDGYWFVLHLGWWWYEQRWADWEVL